MFLPCINSFDHCVYIDDSHQETHLRTAIIGKTGKTVVLPRFYKQECDSGVATVPTLFLGLYPNVF